jgi:tetratricopeptide (TPR) repeat protein
MEKIYECAKNESHLFAENTVTCLCPMCDTSELSFLVAKNREDFPDAEWKQMEIVVKSATADDKDQKFAKFIIDGDEYLANNRFTDAIREYSNALHLDFDNPAAQKKIGEAKKQEEEYLNKEEKVSLIPSKDHEFGLCIHLMDASDSMNDQPFEGIELTKKQLVAKTAANGIFDMKDNAKAADAFIIAYKFDHNISPLLPMTSIKALTDKYKTRENLEKHILSELTQINGATDINSALQVAYKNASDFAAGKYQGLLSNDYKIQHDMVTASALGREIEVPNIRVFLYTDGLQYVNGKSDPLVNPFRDSSIFNNIDILMGGFFGKEEGIDSDGCKELKGILSDCPEHEQKNFFLFDTPNKMGTLKNLFKMASGASGFCPKCLEKYANVKDKRGR